MSRLRGSHAGLSPSPTRAPERAEQEEPETGDRITLDSGRVVTLAIDWSSSLARVARDRRPDLRLRPRPCRGGRDATGGGR
jgi:hypothetical protein